MGEAKRRGTHKQRKAAAIKRDTIARLIKDGYQFNGKPALTPVEQTVIDKLKARRRVLISKVMENLGPITKVISKEEK